MAAPLESSNASITMQATMQLRVVRDDSLLAWSGDLRSPDRLQQAWLGSDGSIQWRDVEVIGESKLAATIERNKT